MCQTKIAFTVGGFAASKAVALLPPGGLWDTLHADAACGHVFRLKLKCNHHSGFFLNTILFFYYSLTNEKL